MRFVEYYLPDYGSARAGFLAAAREIGALVESHRFQANGPNGEPLTMDVARLGDQDAERTVIISSGLHGIEGFVGSAIQLAWLGVGNRGWSPPPRTALVMVHALNPYGFAWQRRCNENNVDLNRNFLDDRGFLDTDPTYQESRIAYERFCRYLNPHSPPSRWEPYRVNVVLQVLLEGYAARRRMRERGVSPPPRFAVRSIWQLGLLELQKTLPVGQYEHPTGLFYGGTEPEETVRVVHQALPRWVAHARDVIHIDLHSGLGRYADYQLFTLDEKGSENERWLAERFGAEAVKVWDPRTAYPARGLMLKNLRNRMRHCRYHGLTVEFGTYAGVRVVGALRAENRAHFHGTPGTASYQWAKSQVMAAFCPEDSRWREAVVTKGLAIIDQAIAACDSDWPAGEAHAS